MQQLRERLVNRLVKDEDLERPLAERVMNESLGFLQLCALEPDGKFSPSATVDPGWHTFRAVHLGLRGVLQPCRWPLHPPQPDRRPWHGLLRRDYPGADHAGDAPLRSGGRDVVDSCGLLRRWWRRKQLPRWM